MGQGNFLIDLSGDTGGGKTTTHRIVASAWGRPSDLMIPEFTAVAVEQLVAFFNGLCVFLQDSHKEKNRRHLGDLGYLVPDGATRLRGAKSGGMRRVQWFKILGFISGEEGFADLVEHEGCIARTIRFSGYPFGSKNKEMEKKVEVINTTIENNFGHAGARWLEFLTKEMRSPEFIPGLKQAHAEAKELFLKDDSPNPGALRAVSYFASVMVTARLLAKCFKWDLSLLERRIMDGFHLATAATEENLPKYQKAFRAFQGWVHKNINKFIRGNAFESKVEIPDRQEIFGIYKAGEFVAVDPCTLEMEFLAKHKFSKAVISQWREEGYLDHEKGRHVKRVRTDTITDGLIKGNPRFYCIRWDAFNSEEV